MTRPSPLQVLDADMPKWAAGGGDAAGILSALEEAGYVVVPRSAGNAPRDLKLPWRRETVGHANVWEVAAKVARDLAVPLEEGLPPNTDATWIVNADNKIVAFVGNGPRQTKNADAIIAAVEALAERSEAAEEVER